MAMALETDVYCLVWQFRAHEEEVLGICVCGSAGIATSSRDHTVRFWSPDPENGHRYLLKFSLAGFSGFVPPLAWMPPCDGFPEGAVALGGTDNMALWDLRTDTLVQWDLRTGKVSETMKEQQVSGLAIDDNGDIISSHTDGTIRRWWKGHLVENWEAHKVAVQAIIKLTSGELITGSSDSTLKLWRGRTCLHTFVGHTDGICFQSIPHPGCVWDVKFLENGDILTACSDGVVRIWTTHSNRFDEILEVLPGLETLKVPGMFVEERLTINERVRLIGISRYDHIELVKQEIDKAENVLPIHVGGTFELCYEDASRILYKLRKYARNRRIVIANEGYITAVSQLYPLKRALKELNKQRRQKRIPRKEAKNLQIAIHCAHNSFFDARESLLEGKHPVEEMSDYMN